MKKKKYLPIIIPSALLILAVIVFFLSKGGTTGTANQGSLASTEVLSDNTPSQDNVVASVPESTEPEEPPFEEYDITLLALGDNLIHMGIVNSGIEADGTRDYSFLFNGIEDLLAVADIKAINQETIFGGNHLGFSGYPTFNSPTEIGDAIAAAGFNVVLHSTNHTADKGVEGIKNCVAFWETHPEVLISGIHAEKEENPEIPILTVKGKTFAILNYTYGPNASVISSGYMGRIEMLCAYNETNGAIDFTTLNPKVITDIQKANEVADIVIVFPHWGTEYQTSPSSFQKDWGMQMTEAGADLIIGTHPHVPQPVEWITAENGNKALCYYSLGNYTSTQKQQITMLEGLAWVTFHVTEDSIYISETNTGVIPLVNHYNYSPTRFENVYPLEEYTEEMALRHGIWGYGGVPFHLADLQKWSWEIFGDWILPKDSILGPTADETLPAAG